MYVMFVLGGRKGEDELVRNSSRGARYPDPEKPPAPQVMLSPRGRIRIVVLASVGEKRPSVYKLLLHLTRKDHLLNTVKYTRTRLKDDERSPIF